MTGFTRTPPTGRALTRAEAAALIRPIAFAAIEAIIPPADPFNVADPCLSPEGHLYQREGNEVFCPHCDKRFW